MRWHTAQQVDARKIILTLDRGAKPDIGQRREFRLGQNFQHAFRSLGENLE